MKTLAECWFSRAARGADPGLRHCARLHPDGRSARVRHRDAVQLHGRQLGGYFLYSFVRMRGVTCKQGELSLVLDVSEFATPRWPTACSPPISTIAVRALLSGPRPDYADQGDLREGQVFRRAERRAEGDHAACSRPPRGP